MNPIQAAEALRSVYHAGYAIPSRSVDMLKRGQLPLEDAMILAGKGEPQDAVVRLATQRVPANIEGHDLFYPDRMQRTFGWSRPYYDEFYEATGRLPPNIATACKTPLWTNDDPIPVLVNVVNLVGVALDSPLQTDYKFLATKVATNAQRFHIIKERLQQQWMFMLAAAQVFNASEIYVKKVGGGVFSNFLQDLCGESYSELYEQSIAPAREAAKRLGIRLLEPKFMHSQLLVPDEIPALAKKGDASKLLFVNAWDPVSLVGNGNCDDRSLDGAFGCYSAMGVLCWPVTNPHMMEVRVPDSDVPSSSALQIRGFKPWTPSSREVFPVRSKSPRWTGPVAPRDLTRASRFTSEPAMTGKAAPSRSVSPVRSKSPPPTRGRRFAIESAMSGELPPSRADRFAPPPLRRETSGEARGPTYSSTGGVLHRVRSLFERPLERSASPPASPWASPRSSPRSSPPASPRASPRSSDIPCSQCGAQTVGFPCVNPATGSRDVCYRFCRDCGVLLRPGSRCFSRTGLTTCSGDREPTLLCASDCNRGNVGADCRAPNGKWSQCHHPCSSCSSLPRKTKCYSKRARGVVECR